LRVKRAKPRPADPRHLLWMRRFCKESGCEFWKMRTGESYIPYDTSPEDVADRCVNNCQQSAMDLARWLESQNFLPLHTLVEGADEYEDEDDAGESPG